LPEQYESALALSDARLVVPGGGIYATGGLERNEPSPSLCPRKRVLRLRLPPIATQKQPESVRI